MMLSSKRTLLYLRVSTSNQAEKGIAIPTQQEKCILTANEQGLVFDPEKDIYIDRGESARSMDRPALIDMLNRCKVEKDVAAIIIYDISRLARDRIDFALIKQTLRKLNIQLISATEPINESPEGQILEGILSSVAEFQSTQNGRKVKANMTQKVRDGWWASKATYGYKNVQEKLSTGKTKAWIEINPTEVPWVNRAFEQFATGEYSEKSLAKKLQEEGFPVRNRVGGSGKLHTSVIARILRDKIYVGIIEWKGFVNPKGKHELFLDQGLFNQVQAILDSRILGSSRNRKLFSILKANSFCDECGSKMTVEEQTTSSGNIIRYLRCLKSKNSERVLCEQKYVHENIYLEQFVDVLKKIDLPQRTVDKLRVKIRSFFSNEQQVYENARKAVLGRIEDTKRKKRNLVLKLIDNEKLSLADTDLYDTVKTDLEKEEKDLTAELLRIENKIVAVVRTVEIGVALAESVYNAFLKAKEPELKALIARTIFKKLHIRDGAIIRVDLNEPLDYLCYSKLKKYPVFNLANTCGR